MGTRGAFGIRCNGQDKILYNHFDSYPTGLGENIVEDTVKLIKEFDWKGIKTLFNEFRFVKDDEKPSEDDKKRLAPHANLTVGNQSLDDWYCLLRNLQGNLYEMFVHAKVGEDYQTFLHDSLFCEWAYILNVDTQELEVYKGFQTEPFEGRYSAKAKDSDEYYGVKLVKAFDVSKARSAVVLKKKMNKLDAEVNK